MTAAMNTEPKIINKSISNLLHHNKTKLNLVYAVTITRISYEQREEKTLSINCTLFKKYHKYKYKKYAIYSRKAENQLINSCLI